MKRVGLMLKLDKCELLQAEVKYLGHKISKVKMTTDPKKFEIIKKMVYLLQYQATKLF